MSSLTYNKTLPPFELQSSLYGIQNLSIKNWPTGKISLIFVSEIVSTSTLHLICSESNPNLFRIYVKMSKNKFIEEIIFVFENQKLCRGFKKLGWVFEKIGWVFKNLGHVFVLQCNPCCLNQPRYSTHIVQGYMNNLSTIYCLANLIQRRSSLLNLYPL